MEAEIAVKQLQAKEGRGLLAIARSWQRAEKDDSLAPSESTAPPTP